MKAFMNMQSNRFFNGKECLVLGAITAEDLHVSEELPQVNIHLSSKLQTMNLSRTPLFMNDLWFGTIFFRRRC